MKDELMFVGYRQFKSKSGNDCNVLEFITKPKKSDVSGSVYVSNVSVFTTPEKYADFIQNTKLLSFVQVSFEIVGNKVKYSI